MPGLRRAGPIGRLSGERIAFEEGNSRKMLGQSMRGEKSGEAAANHHRMIRRETLHEGYRFA